MCIRDRQFVVANDEDNVLRIYREGRTAAPVSALDLSEFLKSDPKHPEADIEAAARIGNRIYWIASHGTNSEGELRSGRPVSYTHLDVYKRQMPPWAM